MDPACPEEKSTEDLVLEYDRNEEEAQPFEVRYPVPAVRAS